MIVFKVHLLNQLEAFQMIFKDNSVIEKIT
jgi:hypothetical protein